MPRIRKDKTARSYAEPFWKIGLYIRLSKEDDNEDESESVINQEKILRDFVDSYFEPGTFVIVDVFADDGLTAQTQRDQTSNGLRAALSVKK